MTKKFRENHKQPVPPPAPTAQVAPLITPLAVSIGEAAAMIGVSRTRYYELIEEKGAPSFHLDKRHLVSVDRLRQWIEAQHDDGGAA